MKRWMPIAGAAVAALAWGQAAAQFKNGNEAISYRQGAMTLMNNHFERIGRMVNNKTPLDPRALQANAELVATLAKLPWAAFVDGSQKGDTDARPEIWSQPDKFKADTLKLQEATARLAEVARGGNADAIKAAFGAAGQACKSCHDDFRARH